MGKSGNGEGNIRKRNNGLWEARIGFHDTNGKFIRKSIYGKTRKEVAQKLNELQSVVSKGGYSEPSKITVSEWLKIWVESRKIEIRDTTLSNYIVMIQAHLEKLGKILLKDLQTYQVQGLINDMKDQGLSDRTAKLAYQILAMALRKAKEEGIIDVVVTDRVKLPKKDPPKDAKTLSAGEVKLLLESIKGHRLEAVIVIALLLGMRIGEIMALNWSDIDFENQTLRISKTLQNLYTHGPDGERKASLRIQNNTKTKSGNRVMGLNDYLILTLKQHQERQEEEKKTAGIAYKDQGLIFCTSIGTPINNSAFRRQYNKMLEDAGLERIRVHDMRHTHASLFINGGGDMKVLQEMLGHSSIKVTADIYAHVSVDTKRTVVDKMQSIIMKEAVAMYV